MMDDELRHNVERIMSNVAVPQPIRDMVGDLYRRLQTKQAKAARRLRQLQNRVEKHSGPDGDAA